MGSANDYKIIAKKSVNYAQIIPAKKTLTDIEQQRYGFYLLIIDAVSQIKDVDELINAIIDTEFCSNVLGVISNDEGIDAVTIDEESNTINLFNFK
jgi:hypothetical protein